MIVVRVARGITDHVPARASEWALALVLVNWGWTLLLPGSVFQTSAVFIEMARWASENQWGWACFAMGMIRFSALFVNGTFPSFRYSPHIRSAMSFLACAFWFTISIGIFQANVPTTGLAVYPVLLLLDMYNAYRAAGDARDADEAAKNATG